MRTKKFFMRNKIFNILLVILMLMALSGCKKNDVVINDNESTIIRKAKNINNYLDDKDYNSIAYSFIYSLKEGTKTYESTTTGTLQAKIFFIDYLVEFNSFTIKNGNTFYSKDNSASIFSNVENEYYMNSKDKILIGKDLKKYELLSMEDFHKTSFSPDQYTIMGYVFNDESIIKAELINKTDDQISIKYILDNESSTHIAKIDMKNLGGLSSYPEFNSIEIILTMNYDYTPISIKLDCVYDASKALLGTSTVTQKAEVVFSKINEDVEITNEEFYINMLGKEVTQLVDNDETTVKDELIQALKKVGFKNGAKISGNLSLDLMGQQFVLDLSNSISFDLEKVNETNIYELFSFYAKANGDDNFSSLVSIIESFASDKLGQYADLIADFKGLEITYDKNGAFYLIPFNSDDKYYYVTKLRIVDILDKVLEKTNINKLVDNSNSGSLTFNKIEEIDENNYKVEILLDEETINSINEKFDNIFNNPDYEMLKTLLGYEGFDSLNISVLVVDGKVNKLNVNLNYLKSSLGSLIGIDDPDKVTFLNLVLEIKEEMFDFEGAFEKAQEISNIFDSVSELKERIEMLSNNVYVSNAYVLDVNSLLNEYNELSDEGKGFLDYYSIANLEKNKNDVNNILLFFQTYYKYDLNNLNNEDIYELIKAYKTNFINSALLSSEIGEEEYNKISNLVDKIDYSNLDLAIFKINGSDENNWDLSNEEILDIDVIINISKYDTTVYTSIFWKLLMSANPMSVEAFETKINNLKSQIN